ncbi:unnamed protein product [Effrenium voratum]|nr:unnamed protein product [Effrenium voratum]
MEGRSQRSNSLLAELPRWAVEPRRARAATDTAASPGSPGWELDEWLFPVFDREAHGLWREPRQKWLQEVEAKGGFSTWLLEGLDLRGMNDRNYLLGLRWTSAFHKLYRSQASKVRGAIANEIEKDMSRTCPGHPQEPALIAATRDILQMMCCARDASVGYMQGLNFTAAVLCCALSRDDAFWCLAALVEGAAAHFGDSLQGVLVDAECIDWLAEELAPQQFPSCRQVKDYSPALLFTKPLCTLLAGCSLPVDAALQCWRAILHASKPRVFLLRILAAFAVETAKKLSEVTEVSELMALLEKSFASSYDASAVLAAAEASVAAASDEAVQKQLLVMEERLRHRGLEAKALRSRGAAQTFHGQLMQEPDLIQRLLQELKGLWKQSGDQLVTEAEFVKIAGPAFAPFDRDTQQVRPFLTAVVLDLDASRAGHVFLKHALIALVLLLGDKPQERIDFIFCLLEQGAGVSKRDFEELARATGQMDLANAWLLSSGAELLEKETFTKALVALPSLAFATLDANKDSRTNSFGLSFTSSSGSLQPIAPKWAPNELLACQLCAACFTCFRRRHHCRACGRLLCNRCSRNRLPLPIIGYNCSVRVCDDCHAVLFPTE